MEQTVRFVRCEPPRQTQLTASTGGSGFLGRTVTARVRQAGATAFVPRRLEFDLTQKGDVDRLSREFSPNVVIHLAGEVGGIGANRLNPGRFFYANMSMGINVVEASREHAVAKLVLVGTVCSYPRVVQVPFREDDLWNGYPEETNAPYGVAKRSLFVMADAYRRQYGLNGICLIPVNLSGPHDNFDPCAGHIIPSLIRKCAEAKARGASFITCWGSGAASREFLYVDDCADAVVWATTRYDGPEPVNLGSGRETSIRDLAQEIALATGFRGTLRWDAEMPDGQPRRCVDVTRAERYFGFRATTSLEVGHRKTVDWYMATQSR